jgi:hypothetical protein
MHKIVIEFTIILLKTNVYMFRALLFYHQGLLDDEPVRPATCGSLIFLKIILRIKWNYVHFFIKIV